MFLKKVFYNMLFKIESKIQRVKLGKDVDAHGFCFIRNNGSISIGNNLHVCSGKKHNPIGSDSVKLVADKGELMIGNDVGLSNCTIVATKRIEIGDRVAIGGGAVIIDSDFHSVNADDRMARKNAVSKPVVIDAGAFIGGYAKIVKGVHIGANSIVGLGAVVTKDIPPNEIWAGNPAKFIKKIENKDE